MAAAVNDIVASRFLRARATAPLQFQLEPRRPQTLPPRAACLFALGVHLCGGGGGGRVPSAVHFGYHCRAPHFRRRSARGTRSLIRCHLSHYPRAIYIHILCNAITRRARPASPRKGCVSIARASSAAAIKRLTTGNEPIALALSKGAELTAARPPGGAQRPPIDPRRIGRPAADRAHFRHLRVGTPRPTNFGADRPQRVHTHSSPTGGRGRSAPSSSSPSWPMPSWQIT